MYTYMYYHSLRIFSTAGGREGGGKEGKREIERVGGKEMGRRVGKRER